MSTEHERGYAEGAKRAAIQLLNNAVNFACSVFGEPDATRDVLLARLMSERAATISMCRRILHAYGDDDWPDNLYLPDLIEKRLLKAWRSLR